jgi:hypothetical protein
VTPPRTPGFAPLTWLWWPVVMAGWSLAAVVMAAEWAASGATTPAPRKESRR